ncbi:MAG: type II secretion system secretin GspD [Deltaproteobacteria bacterium]|nr:type II secretion system secretin GspD [Deltaproteobacteria bacterium]
MTQSQIAIVHALQSATADSPAKPKALAVTAVLPGSRDMRKDRCPSAQYTNGERGRGRVRRLLTHVTLLVLLAAAFGRGTAAAQANKRGDKKVEAVPAAPKKQARKSDDDKDDDVAQPEGLKPFETGIEYEPTSPNKRITFNLEDADLPELVRLISQITGKRFIISSKARSIKATVFAPTKVTVAEAYQAFLSILELNGMALVKSGQYYKIVESGGIENRPIDLLTDDGTVPRGDRFVTRLHRLENIPSDDAAGLLARFKSGDGNVTSYAPTNTLIITDTGTNINRMIRILKVIDIPHSSENIWIEPVFHADANEIAQRLTEIFEASASKKTSSSAPKSTSKGSKDKSAPASVGTKTGESRITKILADERTNSLIIMATEPAYLRILEMLRHLDIAMEGEGNIRVHYLQHSDAEEIAGTLTKLVDQKPTKGGKGGKEAVTVFEGTIAITAHKSSNALVITSSARDYAELRKTIDELDIKRRQVFIEAVIMELNVKRNSSLGLSYHGGIQDFPVDDSLTVMGFQPQSPKSILGVANPDFLTGLAVGVQGPTIDVPGLDMSIPSFGVALSAVAGSSDANILSTPHLIATDNVEAEISIGSNEPLQTSAIASYGSLGSLAGLSGTQSSAAAGLLSSLAGGFGGTVPRQDVGTTIKITPHINDSDEIRLEISEEISSVGAPEQGNVGVKPVNRTRAKTEVSVGDQQTVVIGGLMRDSVSSGQDKVPILGDVPLIGVLFRSSSKDKVKKNLVLFLTPYIIRSADDLRAIYERKMRERQEFIDRYMVATGIDYEPPVDYSRTRGLISEMLKEISLLDERRKLMEDAKAAPPKEHAISESIGAIISSQSDDESSEEQSEQAAEEGKAEVPPPFPQMPGGIPPGFINGTPPPLPEREEAAEPEESE